MKHSIIKGSFALMAMSSTISSATTRDLYAEINVTGSVSLTIIDASGKPGCAKLWWITRVTGGVRQLGLRCGAQRLEIPSFLGISLASKLRGSAEPGIVIKLSAREGVANSVSFKN